MKELIEQIKNCRKCDTIRDYKQFPSESHGNKDAFAILVSEAPGKNSLPKKKYWLGAGGKILRECLPYETELEDIFYLTDIVKCWPNKNSQDRIPTKNEINNCSHFLISEIEKIRPKVILSFGGTSSSFLLNRKVKIKKEHGMITPYNDNTMIITLLHPSRIDNFMDRRLYKIQLALLFAKIKEQDFTNINEIFEYLNEKELPKSKVIKANSLIDTGKLTKGSFTIPSAGNSITRNDVNKNQIRITVDFIEFFPSNSTDVLIEHQNESFKVKFNYRTGKSHILKLGSNLAQKINLRSGMRIRMTVLDKNTFRIE